MNLEHLRTLVSVVEHGSLSAAARARRISQPAVTKQIQRMESDLGLALLVRRPKHEVETTPAGQRVVAFAREMLEQLENLEQELAELKAINQGTLYLAASTIPGEYILPQLLAAFRAEYPQVDLALSISDSAEVVNHLLADEADVGVIGSAERRPGLRLERFLRDEVVLAVPPGHPFADRDEVALEELQGQPLILREEGSGTQRSVEAALQAVGFHLPREQAVLILGSTQSILQAVSQGLGLGFVSAMAAAPLKDVGRLSCTRLQGVDLVRDLYLVYLPERIADPVVARFVQFARTRLAS